MKNYKEFLSLYNADKEDVIYKSEYKELFDILIKNQFLEFKNGKYTKNTNKKIIIGNITINKNFGFILGEDEDIFVFKPNECLNGDLVLAYIDFDKRRNKKEGKIIEVINKENNNFFIEYKNKKLYSLNSLYADQKIIFNGKHNLENMSIYKFEIDIMTNKTIKLKNPKKVVGVNDENKQVKFLLSEYNVDYEFSDDIIKESKNVVLKKDSNENRVDLRDYNFITIDGKESKDLDDAIYLEKIKDGYRLIVSIADVSFYVEENSIIDKEALRRGTSIYYLNKVIPMLPKILSNDICSLNPHVDRLTMSCEMIIDNEGNLNDIKIYESIINSKYRLTYDFVNDILDNKDTDMKEIHGIIKEMNKLKNLLNKKRLERGAIDLETDELKFVFNEDDKIIDVKLRERFDAEKLIEEFMILANEAVTIEYDKLEKPFVYRVHDKPNDEKLDELSGFYKILTNKYFDISDYRMFVGKIKDNVIKRIISGMIIRSMSKAKYQTNNIEHYGLASSNYTHFTSPIRRYPDLIVHRLLKKHLIYKKTTNLEKEIDYLNHVSNIATKAEINATQVEFAIAGYAKTKFMKKKINKVFTAYVVSINEKQIVFELENSIRCLYDLTMQNDVLEVSPYSISFRNKNKIKLGDKLRVKITSVKLKQGKIFVDIMNGKNRGKRR